MSNDMLSTADEFDFTNDSAVDRVEADWEITAAEREETESENGKGVRHVLTFESTEWPYPITLRLFVQYKPTDVNKDTKWVNRNRGILKNIAVAATGEPRYSFDSDDANYIVGKRVRATTKDGGDGFATLSRFRKVA